jgi:hypothetical protein
LILCLKERFGRDRQDHARGGQAHQGRLLAAERLHHLRPLLSVLQVRAHAAQPDRLLRCGASCGRVHRSVGEQDHVGHHQGAPGRHPLRAQQHEVQGPDQGQRGQDQAGLVRLARENAQRIQGTRGPLNNNTNNNQMRLIIVQ